MKRLFFALGIMFAIGTIGIAQSAFAQTATTNCPTNYICAFSAAETFATVTGSPNTPGQPDAYVGYLSFDASSNVTISGMMNINGSVGPIPAPMSPGTCASGSGGAPAKITFADGSQLSFVTDRIGNPAATAPTELQFISIQDKTSGNKTPTANQVRIGVCRQQ